MPSGEPAAKGILIVEDDLDIREALAQILEADGFQVAGAANGQEALTQLKAMAPPCLILLDLMMPVMDGWQFRKVQQLDSALESIPIVVVSADGNVKQKAASLGAAAYLKKPVDIDHLLDVVHRHC